MYGSMVGGGASGHSHSLQERFTALDSCILDGSRCFRDREEAGGKGQRDAKAKGPASSAPDAAKAALVLSAKARKRQAKIVRPLACQATSKFLWHLVFGFMQGQKLHVIWTQPKSAGENIAAKF